MEELVYLSSFNYVTLSGKRDTNRMQKEEGKPLQGRGKGYCTSTTCYTGSLLVGKAVVDKNVSLGLYQQGQQRPGGMASKSKMFPLSCGIL